MIEDKPPFARIKVILYPSEKIRNKKYLKGEPVSNTISSIINLTPEETKKLFDAKIIRLNEYGNPVLHETEKTSMGVNGTPKDFYMITEIIGVEYPVKEVDFKEKLKEFHVLQDVDIDLSYDLEIKKYFLTLIDKEIKKLWWKKFWSWFKF